MKLLYVFHEVLCFYVTVRLSTLGALGSCTMTLCLSLTLVLASFLKSSSAVVASSVLKVPEFSPVSDG